jgi:hypothetical protein
MKVQELMQLEVGLGVYSSSFFFPSGCPSDVHSTEDICTSFHPVQLLTSLLMNLLATIWSSPARSSTSSACSCSPSPGRRNTIKYVLPVPTTSFAHPLFPSPGLSRPRARNGAWNGPHLPPHNGCNGSPLPQEARPRHGFCRVRSIRWRRHPPYHAQQALPWPCWIRMGCSRQRFPELGNNVHRSLFHADQAPSEEHGRTRACC